MKAPPPKRPETDSPWWVNLGESDEQNMTVTEIVAGWKSGTITEDAYVWRDGWDDWLPVLEVPELRAAIEVGAKAPGAKTVPPGGPAKTSGLAGSALASKPPPRFPAAGADEFLDVDVDPEPEASTASPPKVQQNSPPTSMTSQQLSLQALKAEMQPAGAKKATGKRGRSLDEMLGLGGATATPVLALGTADLATAPAPPTPKPEPVVVQSMPAPVPAGMPRTGTILLAMFAAMVIGGLAVAVVLLMNQQKTAANTPAAATAAAATKAPAPSAAAAPTAKAEEKAPDPPAASSASAAANEAAPAAGQARPQTAAKAGSDKETPAVADSRTKLLNEISGGKAAPAPDPKVEVKDKPSAGVSSFDKKAALAALSTVASQCTACRRLDGPKGSGKALVTFAPSGRVTAVNVTGGAFQGTKVGSCVAGVFRRAKVPSFSGDPVTVAKSFAIPE